jgi:predicted HTH domain antitoxin
MAVEIAVRLPEIVAEKLRKQGSDLSQLSLEKLVCSLYRSGELTHREAMEAVGLNSRIAMDEVLARHQCHRDFPWEEFEADRKTLEDLRGR